MPKTKIATSIIILLCLAFNTAFSQKGIPYITYIETRENFEAENWSVSQGEQNTMLFANRKGLSTYDGNEWGQISIPGAVTMIRQNPLNGKVYLILENNYGILSRNDVGLLEFESLIDTSDYIENISDIQFTDSLTILTGGDFIRLYDEKDLLNKVFTSAAYGKFKGILFTPDKALVNIDQKGLFEINNDTLLSTNTNVFSEEEILFSLPYDEKQVLVGSASGQLSLFNGSTTKNYPLSNPDYLIENGLSQGKLLNDSSYAFSTLYGGVIIVNSKDGKIDYTLNYETGLPDDEIYSMGIDYNNGIWLTYEFGICRVDLGLPIKDYSNYPGIEGLYTNSIWYNSELYVSTTEGLYYLTAVKNYEDVEMYFKKEITEITKKETRKNRRLANQEGNKEDRKIFGIFKRKRDESEETVSRKTTKTNAAEAVKPQYVKRKVSKLKSIEHVFEKIDGLSSRCQYMQSTKNGLLVGSSSGLYVVNSHSAKQILSTRNIHFISLQNDQGHYQVCSDAGVFNMMYTKKGWKVEEQLFESDEAMFSILNSDSSTWISGYDAVYRIRHNSEDSISVKQYSFKSRYPEELYLASADSMLYLFSSSSIRYYSADLDSFLIFNKPGFRPNDISTLKYFPSESEDIWLKIDNKLVQFKGDSTSYSESSNIFGLFDNVNNYFPSDQHGGWIVDNYNKIYKSDFEGEGHEKGDFNIYLNNISNEMGAFFNPNKLTLKSREKLLRISVSAPFFLKNESTLYRFLIQERMEKWSTWSSNSTFEFYTEPGEYRIKIQAKNILDEISEPLTIAFKVKPPFHQTVFFYLLLLPFVLGGFYLIILVRERKLKRDKQILEEKVQQRTLEILKQKEKIEIQKDEIQAKQDDITSSINYARRIQEAILPAKSIFEKSFSDYFIFYKPRDIVSGDFYWINENKEIIIFAAADCTGHGVPGAFMSMLGNSFLNEITKGSETLSSGEILDALRDKITEALSQSRSGEEAKDGMDITLCIYNKKKKTIEYSGAYNPLYLIRNTEFIEYKADRMPIGYFPTKVNFKTQIIKVKKNDIIYLFSDGFPDQFGGPKEKKFTTKRFKQILVEQSSLPLSKQHDFLEKQLDDWQKDIEQIDDILVLGIRI